MMGRHTFKDKNQSFKNRGDKIEVKLMDESFRPFYKKIVKISDDKGITQIIKDLNNFGINLTREHITKKPDAEWFE